MMGMEDVDESVTLLIGQNVEYLNQEFEGSIKFEIGNLVIDPQYAMIPDLHTSFVQGSPTDVNRIIEPIENGRGIHVYLFDTYAKAEDQGPMLGFTPILRGGHKEYSSASPEFDRQFISYEGLSDMTTLVHEMGHFLGLSHPWEMSHINIKMMGLNDDSAERNHMTYHPEVNQFTPEQLERMQHYALNFRSYMISRIEHQYVAHTSAFGTD